MTFSGRMMRIPDCLQWDNEFEKMHAQLCENDIDTLLEITFHMGTILEAYKKWKELEEKYMPWRKYDGIEFFENGGWWYHKIHIFLYPFYYINYTLTTMGAMEFKKKMAEDKSAGWKDYMKLCSLGGSLGYLDTLKAANLSVPFEKGSVQKATSFAIEELEKQMKKEEK